MHMQGTFVLPDLTMQKNYMCIKIALYDTV
jgi:hypothetical protein